MKRAKLWPSGRPMIPAEESPREKIGNCVMLLDAVIAAEIAENGPPFLPCWVDEVQSISGRLRQALQQLDHQGAQ